MAMTWTLALLQHYQFWNSIFYPPSLFTTTCELGAWRPTMFFKAFQVLKVSSPSCFHFLSYSDWTSQLRTSTFSLAYYLFSKFVLLFCCSWLNSPPWINQSPVFPASEGQVPSSGESGAQQHSLDRYWIFSFRNPLAHSWLYSTPQSPHTSPFSFRCHPILSLLSGTLASPLELSLPTLQAWTHSHTDPPWSEITLSLLSKDNSYIWLAPGPLSFWILLDLASDIKLSPSHSFSCFLSVSHSSLIKNIQLSLPSWKTRALSLKLVINH